MATVPDNVARSAIERQGLPNGAGAAAILAAGIGCFVFGILALTADALSLADRLLRFWPPSGSLSGTSTCAVLVWLLVWRWLAGLWRKRDVALLPVTLGAVALLCASLALTFPPLMDLLQGK